MSLSVQAWNSELLTVLLVLIHFGGILLFNQRLFITALLRDLRRQLWAVGHWQATLLQRGIEFITQFIIPCNFGQLITGKMQDQFLMGNTGITTTLVMVNIVPVSS